MAAPNCGNKDTKEGRRDTCAGALTIMRVEQTCRRLGEEHLLYLDGVSSARDEDSLGIEGSGRRVYFLG